MPTAPSKNSVCATVKLRGSFDVTFAVDSSLDDPIGNTIIDNQQYPVGASSELMLHLLRPEHTLLDVGAHIGTYALPAAALGCRVIAVDGSPRNCELMREAVERNHFERVTVVQAAVSDVPGNLTFTPWGPHGHVTTAVEGAHMPRTEVQAVTVDSLLADLKCDHVDFVKMDIEGWEPQAIFGMKQLLSGPNPPMVIFESNSAGLERYGRTTDEVLRALESFGYRNYLIDHHELGRIIPVSADDVQPECVMDYLAARNLPADMYPWRLQPFTRPELTMRILTACTDPHPPYRRHSALALQKAPSWLIDQHAVRAALESLRTDPQVTVRQAAAWSALLAPLEPLLPIAVRKQSLIGRLARWLLGKAS